MTCGGQFTIKKFAEGSDVMFRFSVFLFVALIVSAQQSQQVPVKRPQSEIQASPEAAEKKTGSAPKSSVPPSASSAGGVREPASQAQTKGSDQAPGHSHEYLQNFERQLEDFKPISDILSTWALVVIGWYGVRTALRTLRAIEQQVRANEAAAQAALRQANAARHQTKVSIHAAKLAEKALLLTERADVLVDAFTISTFPVLQPDTVFALRSRNFGRTRASRVEMTARIFNPDVIHEVHIPPLPLTVLGSGDKMTNVFPQIGEWTTPQTFENIQRGVALLRFEAEVRYIDVFGKSHATKCSGIFHPPTCSFVVDANTEAN